jgi:uncharacterized protein (DUF779 family)
MNINRKEATIMISIETKGNQKRLDVTPAAVELIEKIRSIHGDLMFHQSGGCCDGSAPMCYPKGEFRLGENEVHLGDIAGCGFYMSESQFEYWKYSKITLDVTPGRASGFSLEGSYGLRFVTKSELLED